MADAAALDPSEVVRVLRFTAASLQSGLPEMPPKLLSWHPGPDEWCIKEVLGHLIEAERRGFAGRIRIILSSREPVLETWDQAQVARERRDCGRELDEILGEFQLLRDSSIGLVAALGEADLLRGGHHPRVGYLRVGDLLQEWVFHDQNHLRQMLANVQSYAWPHMGTAQQFY